MSGQSLMIELNKKYQLLEDALNSLKKRGVEYAQTERDYRKALAQFYLIALNKGTPVTAIRDLSRGENNIADLKFNRDVADSKYKSALEAINVYKIAVRILQNQIDREWNRSGN